ncbi:unnamed protein product [Soboliphyme baturini]|uniref:ZP domain-containing protein n=1 Tax=Soboliphyme baturini TaxID=241478 RepID=A0A183J5U3_9BILA|nr:unnamed protein product [Soboliphyme baturini]
MTVVAMFHPVFLTVGDKAWHISCLYASTETSVTSSLDVSDLPTQSLTHEIAAPVCTYGIYNDLNSEERARIAVVGQPVYHKWHCDTDAEDIYCAEVHSCEVSGGPNTSVVIVEENGCVKDTYLMSQIKYTGRLTAVSESPAFKFADTPTLHIRCQIRLTLSDGQPCQRSSSSCNANDRRRRSVRSSNIVSSEDGADIDVYSNSLVILDVEESPGEWK